MKGFGARRISEIVEFTYSRICLKMAPGPLVASAAPGAR